jgi:hypothetical protein
MAEGNSTQRALKRYGPIAAVLILVVGVILLVGGGDDGDGDDTTEPDARTSDLPLIFQEAEAQGIDDIDWGEGCDTDIGRVKIPVRNAAPCVEPWEGDDNGGATAQGVTADSIKVVVYEGEPDPLQQAAIGAAGADVDPAKNRETTVAFLELLEDVYETYGRTLDIEVVKASGRGDDATAAQADARKIIDMKPFAVVGGPAQTAVYWQEITNAGILCVGGCSLAVGEEAVEDVAPFLWPTTPSPEQADTHLVELVGKQLVGKNAEFAGDPELREQERVFGWVQAERETNEFKARNDAFDALLAEEYDTEIVARSTYLFNVATAQESATTVVARMRDAGVTTVILSVDPIVPGNITREATKQGYFPEWVVGPSVLADTTIFGRTFDPEQWQNTIGISLPTARADDTLYDSYFVYQWYYGEAPPVNTHAVLLPGPALLMLGIHLAGPELSPDTFEAGLFRYPPEDAGKTYAHVSWGEELWGRPDHNLSDDAAAWWWDPEATGEDEAGNPDTCDTPPSPARRCGAIRYIDGGTRFLPGEWPDDPLPFFEEEGSVTVYDELPEGDALPDYDPWPGSPAAA